MRNLGKVIDAFITGDYFILFLVITLAILAVLVLALFKSRSEYNEIISENDKEEKEDIIDEVRNEVTTNEDDDIISELESLMASSSDDVFDENKPLVKQIDVPNVKTYNNIIDDYETSEEENAVISAEELEKKTQERLETLGETDNQAVIAKYEEEQEKKAIISYEQLLKNASNISLTYKEEEKKDKNAPKVNKVEVEQKEIVGAQLYLEEEEFLKILKEFRLTL